MKQKGFHGVDIGSILEIQGTKRYGASIAVASGDSVETFCLGTGRFGKDFPVNPDIKNVFRRTLKRYKWIIKRFLIS